SVLSCPRQSFFSRCVGLKPSACYYVPLASGPGLRPPLSFIALSLPSTVNAAIIFDQKAFAAHSSVTTAQPYFSPRSNNNRCLLQKPISPVILMIDRTAAYSDRQPY